MTVVAVGAGLSELVDEARVAAEPDLPVLRGVWAEAVAMLVANTARMRSFFINEQEWKCGKEC